MIAANKKKITISGKLGIEKKKWLEWNCFVYVNFYYSWYLSFNIVFSIWYHTNIYIFYMFKFTSNYLQINFEFSNIYWMFNYNIYILLIFTEEIKIYI